MNPFYTTRKAGNIYKLIKKSYLSKQISKERKDCSVIDFH